MLISMPAGSCDVCCCRVSFSDTASPQKFAPAILNLVFTRLTERKETTILIFLQLLRFNKSELPFLRSSFIQRVFYLVLTSNNVFTHEIIVSIASLHCKYIFSC